MAKKFTGGCLCGKINYEIDGPIGSVMNCHCTKCRKWHGSAFRTRASVKTDYFRWSSGEELLGEYWSSANVKKTFCKNCGSSLVSFYPNYPETVGLALGTLNEDPGRKPECHIYVDSKAPWHDITDNLPQYGELPPGDRGSVMNND